MSLTNPPTIPAHLAFARPQTLELCGFGSLGAFPHDPPHAQRVYTHAHMGRTLILPTSQKVKKDCKDRELGVGILRLTSGAWEVCPHE